MTISNISNLLFALMCLVYPQKRQISIDILFSFFPIITYYYYALLLIYTVFSQRYCLLVRKNDY